MNPGDKCICQESDWYNAFGETSTMVTLGMRLTVLDSRYIAGSKFYSFEETPKTCFFLSMGFAPLRQYN